MANDAVSRSFEDYVAGRGQALLRFGYVLTGDQHLGEDLVQEALTRVHRRWSRITALDHPDAYVRRIIVNDYLSWKRRLASRLVFVAEPLEGRSPHAQGGDPASVVVERDAMWRLLAQLPPQQRTVLVLRFYEDCTDEEIGHLVRCSAATVRSHASKALARLRTAAATHSILNGAE